MMRPQFEWLRTLRHRWDALAHQWNLRVLGYNTEQQREFMSWLGMPRADWQGLAATLFAALAALAIALLVWSMRRTTRSDPVQRAWRQFCDKLARRGVVRAPHEGPADFTERAALRLPVLEQPIRGIGALYVELRYGPVRSTARVQDLARRVRGLRLT